MYFNIQGSPALLSTGIGGQDVLIVHKKGGSKFL